jgi:hypothetical protein
VVNIPFEHPPASHGRHGSLAAGSNCHDDAVKPSVFGGIDNPAAIIVLVYPLYGSVKLGPGVKSVLLPDLSDVTSDLLTIWTSALVF